jgi:hypothetical protein
MGQKTADLPNQAPSPRLKGIGPLKKTSRRRLLHQGLLAALLVTTQPIQAYDPDDLQQLLTTKQCPGCNLSHAPLAEANLAGALLQRADLTGADLTRTDLSRADLSGAQLDNARLTETDLRASILRDSSLVGTNLSEVRLVGADLRGADLSHLDVDLDLEFIELLGVLLEGARFKNGVRCAAYPEKGGFGCAAEAGPADIPSQ